MSNIIHLIYLCFNYSVRCNTRWPKIFEWSIMTEISMPLFLLKNMNITRNSLQWNSKYQILKIEIFISFCWFFSTLTQTTIMFKIYPKCIFFACPLFSTSPLSPCVCVCLFLSTSQNRTFEKKYNWSHFFWLFI